MMLKGKPESLREVNAVIINRANSGKIGSPDIGMAFEMNDRTARVVGIADAPPDLNDAPFVFTTFDRAKSYVPQERRQLSFVLAAPVLQRDIRSVQEEVFRETGLKAYTS